MNNWSWDKIGTFAVSVITLLVLLFGGIRGVATQDDLAAVEERLTAAINQMRTELKADVQEIRQYHVSHLEDHAEGGPSATPN